jgi:hypothetical protein
MQIPNGSSGVETVPVTTIDAEVERLGLRIGLLKADVEGVELAVLRGAKQTLLRDRPELNIAIYHNEQLVTVPEWVQALGGYRLDFRQEAPFSWAAYSLAELRLFAIPFSFPLED